MDKVLTKEEIRVKWINHTPLKTLDECVEGAMGEYAKQEKRIEAIKLLQFMYASCAETIPNTRPAKWNIDLNTEVTFEELYELYLQSIK